MKIKNIINWKDKYKTKLCIYHHLAECKRKYEKYVDVDAECNILDNYPHNYKKQAEFELNKELIDLFLLLESHIKQNDLYEILKHRINRFEEKSKED